MTLSHVFYLPDLLKLTQLKTELEPDLLPLLLRLFTMRLLRFINK